MSDIKVDGRTTVWFLPTIASSTLAPTVSEINAGVRISKYMTPDGLIGFETQQALLDNSGFESEYDTNVPGRKSFADTALMLKEKTGDAGYTAAVAALAEETDGFVVIRDTILVATAATAAQIVDVHTVRAGEHQIMGRNEKNSLLKRRIPVPVAGETRKRIAVLA